MATTRREKAAADLERLAVKGMTPAELECHRIANLNRKAEKIVELGALELQEYGATSYAAGLRCAIFSAINALSELEHPERRSDLERVKAYCDELLEDPTTAA